MTAQIGPLHDVYPNFKSESQLFFRFLVGLLKVYLFELVQETHQAHFLL